MKKSEKLLKESRAEENDTKAWNLYFKAQREKRFEVFISSVLPLLEKATEVEKRKNGSFTFFHVKTGKIDFYPKSNKILFREGNKWKSNGLIFILKLFKCCTQY